ncbi:MAG: succinylglutamate desuccinylase/aspartoacylase family protein [Lamprobacter sp.]|uniref:succinylglutamate desuccinylase/aspartoacylase family protein n=1 Tax=Lamprobacter sp. TaxID=3100796 RepID=UPI002B25D8AA|nr:succinylglutamate desuccinylase/aspartoacylase family protein [Lamprobacter sp.]MEA3639568.1 succinylglutamate desuccinylase/aspartoacylase family protein [Lamprobacter sp.]
MARASRSQSGIRIGGQLVRAGERARVDLPLPILFTQNPVVLPVHVLHGRRPGPRLFVTAAVHGDEINGIAIIRRLLTSTALRSLRGTLLAVPVVNVYGFVRHSRYLPDRRDLNRSFPGSESGSLAGRLAATLMNEIVIDSDLGIDLHTGAAHRENLPQIRAQVDEIGVSDLARAFGAPVILDADLRDGSLRAAAAALDVPVLLYEAGEALRFDELSIRAGVRGVLGVMRELGMIRDSARRPGSAHPPMIARSSIWARAHTSGMLRFARPLGAWVEKGEQLATVADPFGNGEEPVTAPAAGIVIGRMNLPLITEGEALFHIARFKTDAVADAVEHFQTLLEPDDSLEEPID